MQGSGGMQSSGGGMQGSVGGMHDSKRGRGASACGGLFQGSGGMQGSVGGRGASACGGLLQGSGVLQPPSWGASGLGPASADSSFHHPAHSMPPHGLFSHTSLPLSPNTPPGVHWQALPQAISLSAIPSHWQAGPHVNGISAPMFGTPMPLGTLLVDNSMSPYDRAVALLKAGSTQASPRTR